MTCRVARSGGTRPAEAIHQERSRIQRPRCADSFAPVGAGQSPRGFSTPSQGAVCPSLLTIDPEAGLESPLPRAIYYKAISSDYLAYFAPLWAAQVRVSVKIR